MSQYVQYTDLVNLIDANQLAAMTNDFDVNNPVNSSLINNICTLASTMVDGYLSGIYSVPFINVPDTVYTSAVIFAAEMLFERRLSPGEANPFTSQANLWRSRLEDIGSGKIPLDNAVRKVVTPVAYISTVSRINSTIY